MLHIVKNSHQLFQLNSYLLPSDGILLVEDAVYLANDKHVAHESLEKITNQIFILEDDLRARGLMSVNLSPFHLVDFEGFVDLTIQHPQAMTWD
ncbi:hypothetical protein BCU68_02730 [Vibrio sp. 10N.286.49.B3]|uniref:sulfurtransferase complex subunit TusB n=1 Tax=Vibrio sp. 10N.286.49.B3 TaxID=1880855 RepID=UPI000C84A7FE|nr:sulfurtransferase complex subunit TusB [Vibrio sp. 10N.286.49.B3]PMH46311.1 hypothetical protein BCU68_02730 [Vibrio sp. 10N.286.49.B3]